MREMPSFLQVKNGGTTGSPLLAKHVTDLEIIVSRAYGIFSDYTISRPLDVCKCCLSADEELQLLKLPLNKIDCGLMEYWNQAVKTDTPDLAEFKYFLPRILELISKYEFPGLSLELSLQSFNYYSRNDWQDEEWLILDKFLTSYFLQSLNAYPLPDATSLGDILAMIDKAGFDVKSMLQLWESANCDEAVFHFCRMAEFYINFGSEKKINNACASANFIKIFSDWLDNDDLLSGFAAKIETLILNDQLHDENISLSLDRSYEILSMLGHCK